MASTITLYCVFLARTIKPSSIPGYLSVVRLLHLDAGLPNPLENWQLTQLRKGIARCLGRPPLQKLPITPQILQELYSLLDLSHSLDLAFWSACLVAFYAFLRKSSLLPKDLQEPGDKCLLVKDVCLGQQHDLMYITLRYSKTIQFNQRVVRIPLAAQPGSRLCPVTAISALLHMTEAPSEKPLFSYFHGTRNLIPLTHTTFVSLLKAKLSMLGYNPKSYSGHSFRRGGCSFAFSLGIPPLVIKLLGDWKSNAYERYVCISEDRCRAAAQALAIATTFRYLSSTS